MKVAPGKNLIFNRHTHLLAVILAIFLASPYFNNLHPKFPLVTSLFLIALLFILRTLGVRRQVFGAAVGLGAAVFLLQMFDNIYYGLSVAVPMSVALCAVYFVFLLLCVLLMGAKLFRSSTVTADTIVGGINVYFLLGFLWTFLYYMIYRLDAGAFHFSSEPSITYFFCFSFSTLATIGFGDMFPVNKWGMVLACLEGVAGQLFLAVFIARLVSLHAGSREKS